MAIIYSYPVASAVEAGDLVIGTDITGKQTKNFTLQSIVDLVVIPDNVNGTVNTIPVFTGTKAIGDSIITQDSGANGVSIGGDVENNRKLKVHGNSSVDGNLYLSGASNTYSIEVGQSRTTEGVALLDLTGEIIPDDYGLRLIRYGGENAESAIIHTGTSNLRIRTENSADTVFENTKVGIGITAPQRELDVNGGIRVRGPLDLFQQNDNTFAGTNAGNWYNVVGNSNTAFGEDALAAITTASRNTAVGLKALKENTSGNNNTGIGNSVLEKITIGSNNTVVGDRALQLVVDGQSNTAIGQEALLNQTTGNFNVSVGRRSGESVTTGFKNTFLGQLAGTNVTTGANNIYIGDQSAYIENTINSIVIGAGAVGNGSNTTTLGNDNITLTEIKGNVKIGTNNTLSGSRNFSVGSNNNMSGTNSITAGINNVATGNQSVAFGDNNTASGVNSTAIGRSTLASGSQSTAIGYDTEAAGDGSFAGGGIDGAVPFHGGKALGRSSLAFGLDATASQAGSIAIGSNTDATGLNSVAIGNQLLSSGNNSVAMGVNTLASGDASTALGSNTIASSQNSFATGNATQATGGSSTAMGQGSTASGTVSISIGNNNNASGDFSFAAGSGNTASGPGSIVMGGVGTGVSTASGQASAVFGGLQNNAAGLNSTILGGQKNTIDVNSSDSGIIGGEDNEMTAGSTNSILLGGIGLRGGGINQTVVGVANVSRNDAKFIVGIGGYTNPTTITRENAFVVKDNGQIVLDKYISSNFTDNNTAFPVLNVDGTGKVNKASLPDMLSTIPPEMQSSTINLQNGSNANLGASTKGIVLANWTVVGSNNPATVTLPQSSNNLEKLITIVTTASFGNVGGNNILGIKPAFGDTINDTTAPNNVIELDKAYESAEFYATSDGWIMLRKTII